MSAQLFSRILGEESLPHLVILHGLLGSADNWQTLGKRYADHFRVHLVDARNHGRSPHFDEHSYELMVLDLVEYLNTHGFLGHSMGGKTVMAFAEDHPERVEKMIIADIAPKAYTVHHEPIFDALLATNPSEATSRGDVEIILSDKLNSEPTLVPFLMKGLHREKSGGYSWSFNVEALAKNLEVVTEEIHISINTLPVLFIRGLNSNYCSDEELERIEAFYMQMEVAEIEDAGHWLHAEKPDEFLELTLHWFL
jgi:esterase